MSQKTESTIVLPHEEIESLWFGGLDLQPGQAPSLGPLLKRWFHADTTFDSTCRCASFLYKLTKDRTYEPLVQKLLQLPFDELLALGDTPDHSLTLILLLDQFPRNFSRGSPFPFTQTDPLCQTLAEHVVLTLSHDTHHPPYKKFWYYLPFGHAENVAYQELSVSKMAFTCWECRQGEWTQFHEMVRHAMDSAWRHYVIVARFGRFPHRNEAMGRETTVEERKFLDEGGDTFGQPKPKET